MATKKRVVNKPATLASNVELIKVMAGVVKNVDQIQDCVATQSKLLDGVCSAFASLAVRTGLLESEGSRDHLHNAGPQQESKIGPMAHGRRNAINMCSAEASRSIPSVIGMNNFVHESLSELEQAIEELAKRLQPVLRSQDDCAVACGVPRPQAMCEMAGVTESFGAMAVRMRAGVVDLIQRLEI